MRFSVQKARRICSYWNSFFLLGEGRFGARMSTSLAINYFPHSQKQDISTVAKNGLSVGKSELWEDFKNNKIIIKKSTVVKFKEIELSI